MLSGKSTRRPCATQASVTSVMAAMPEGTTKLFEDPSSAAMAASSAREGGVP